MASTNHPLCAGIVGIGFMGWIHWLAYQQSPHINVAAICSRDPKKRAGDWTGIQGNFGPPGEQVDLAGVNVFDSLDEMLQSDVDIVNICLPPHLHVAAAEAALAAGKHVFCEKPLALTAEACDHLVACAAKHERQLLVGQVLPMFPEYAYVVEAVREQRFGKPLGGYFKRVISDPLWLADFYDPNRCGGPLIDLHVHDAHLIRLLFGMPSQVITRGRFRGEVVEYCHTLFDFAGQDLAVAASSGVLRQQGRSFTHGFEIHLERATLQYELAVIGEEAKLMMPLTVLHAEDGRVEQPELVAGDAAAPFVAELEAVATSVRTLTPSPVLSGELARDAVTLCHRQTEAARSRQPVKV